MPYAKTTWATGDVITATRLNNAENGIAAAVPLDGSVAMTGGLSTPSLAVIDNRNAATTPASYSKNWTAQFKTLVAVGLNGIATGTYCVLVGMRGFTDDTGGKSHEFAHTDSGLYKRCGTAALGWGPWELVAVIAAGVLTIKGATPALILADTDAAQPWGKVRVDTGFLYIDQLTNAGVLNATRIKVDLLTGAIYTGAALDQKMCTEKQAIAYAIALGG